MIKGVMPVKLGKWSTFIFGGPYLNKPPGFFGIKMAMEISAHYHISIPTKDFSVPDPDVFRRGLIQSLPLIADRSPIYVGCMGGIGRTGLFLGGVAKMMSEAQRIRRKPGFDPVAYVRNTYLDHAIETAEQQAWLAALPVRDIAEYALTYQGC